LLFELFNSSGLSCWTLLVLVKTLGMFELCRFKVIYNYVHNLLSFLRRTVHKASALLGKYVIRWSHFSGDKKKHWNIIIIITDWFSVL